MDEIKSSEEEQVVDLGDAKEMTMGSPASIWAEDNPMVSGKP